MRSKRFLSSLFLAASTVLILLTSVACDPDPPAPTPTPVASPTSTALPTATHTPTHTSTPTSTPTQTPTPTETPQPTFVSVPGPQPTALVNKDAVEARQKYEEGLAKWRAQNVLEYDIVVRHESPAPFAGTWNLRVKPGVIEALSYSQTGVITPTTPPPRMDGEALRFLTVDGLFESVAFRLNEQFGPALEARADYLSSFEPDLGYPISIEIKPRRGNDLASKTTVERLTIIRRAITTPTSTAAPTDTPAPIPTNTLTPRPAPPTVARPTASVTGTPTPVKAPPANNTILRPVSTAVRQGTAGVVP